MMPSQALHGKSPNTFLQTWLTPLLLGLAYVGFVDSTYLAATHFLGASPGCSISSGCESVLSSTYSKIGPVPIALFGSFYYAAFFLMTIGTLVTPIFHRKYLSRLAMVGFAASAGLVAVQIFVIKAFCPYCLVSAAISTLLLVLATRPTETIASYPRSPL